MIKSYLEIAVRHLLKNKVISLIHILGLTIGISAFLLILHYVYYEKSYDRFHPDAERIYRLRYERTTQAGTSVRFASCTPPAAPRIRESFPEVEKIARIFRYRASLSYQDIKFYEERMYFVEPSFLEIFNFDFIKGNPVRDLQEPGHAFVSQSMARKYFGDEDPLGKIISVDKKMDFQVSGIFKDIPHNSHIKFDILLSFENLANMFGPEIMESWGHTMFYTYLRLQKDTNPIEFQKKLAGLVESEFGEVLREWKMKMELPLQTLYDIHLTSHYMQEYEMNGDRQSVNFLFIISLLIIAIAWVNYINLSTARALNRAKEVGLRKVVGASRKQLSVQFFTEIFIINLLALLASILLIEIFMPVFSQVTNIPPNIEIWSQNWLWIILPAISLAGIFLSGLYPVMVMSSFKPQTALQGKFSGGKQGLNLRKVLVVFQFAMALILLTGTITIYRQISFMRHQKLGFDHEQVLVVKSPRVQDEMFEQKVKAFKENLLQNNLALKACHVTEVPGRQILWDNGGIKRAGEDDSQGKNYLIVGIDYDFLEVFDLELAAGRNFSESFSTDKDALILNEFAMKWMGFESAESTVGQKVDYWGNIYTIIGVLKNYHQQSPKVAFEPNLYRLLPSGRGGRGNFAMKLDADNIRESIAQIQNQYEKFFPGNPFSYFFLDEYFDQQYQSDELFGRVFFIFSILAVIITSLGIFGLSSFNATQRTKEIGIRKVVGANVGRILLLLTRDILYLILIAFLIVVPMLVFGLNKWLNGFAHHMQLNIVIFIFPLVFLTVITLITISFQTIKTAMTNPMEALRYE